MQSFLSDDDNINYFAQESSWDDAEELTIFHGNQGNNRHSTVFQNASYIEDDDNHEQFEIGNQHLLEEEAGHRTSNL